MSQLENQIEELFVAANIKFERQKNIPLNDWPWRVPRSHRPKCDFYLPQGDIYVEVKGLMTIYAMAKMSWLCRQNNIRYYILQGTEGDWTPSLNSPVAPVEGYVKDDQQIQQQVKELAWLTKNQTSSPSKLSLARLKHYIGVRVEEYRKWNGEWY